MICFTLKNMSEYLKIIIIIVKVSGRSWIGNTDFQWLTLQVSLEDVLEKTAGSSSYGRQQWLGYVTCIPVLTHLKDLPIIIHNRWSCTSKCTWHYRMRNISKGAQEHSCVLLKHFNSLVLAGSNSINSYLKDNSIYSAHAEGLLHPRHWISHWEFGPD